MSKVPRSAEEASEEVERIVVLAGTSSLLVLLDTLMAILVVYAPRFFVDKDIVGFSYGYELVMC